jgi:hypothetical protein
VREESEGHYVERERKKSEGKGNEISYLSFNKQWEYDGCILA